MTLTLYLQSIAMFIVGQILYVLWIKVPALKARAASVNKPFEWIELWRCDNHVLIGLNVFAIGLFVGLDEIIHYEPRVINYLKWGFWLVGMFGCTVGFKYLSKYEKMLINLIDKKANAFDQAMGRATTSDEAVRKAAAQGIDATKPPQE